MIKLTKYFLVIFSILFLHCEVIKSQTPADTTKLTEKQKAITLMAAFTAKGDLGKLKPAINNALDAGLTINECKEVFLHTYAYCGFPRSIQGLNTLIATIDER